MSRRTLTPRSTLETLAREARRWLRALRAEDPAVRGPARERLARALPDVPPRPGLRDVQRALAREHGLDGWNGLRDAVARARAERPGVAADDAELPALLEAAAGGDEEAVAAILDRHPGLVSRAGVLRGHVGRRTALHFAVEHAAVVRRLLARGADPNARDEGDDAYPLHFAAARGDLEVIRLLVDGGADTIGDGTYHALDVLGWATVFGTGERAVVEYLLAHGARWTIWSAVAQGEADVIRALVRADPSLLAQRMDATNLRRTPLHLALVKKQSAALDALIALGADLEATDAAALTALDHAALGATDAVVARLLAAGAAVRLPAAVALGRADEVERLLAADPDALRTTGRHAALVVRAAERAPAEVIDALVRAGASPNVWDRSDTAADGTSGYTALHAAAIHGNRAAAAALLRHGADPNVRESRWRGTPAGWAQHGGHADVRDLILAGAIDPFQAIDFGLAARIPEIVQRAPWLLDRPFVEYLPGEPGDWGPHPWHTPLAWAVVQGDVAAARALLEAGASTTVRAPDGRTLRDIARDAGRDEVVTLLDASATWGETASGIRARFAANACPDHHVRGGPAHAVARGVAARLLRRHPHTVLGDAVGSVVSGDVEGVRRILDTTPTFAKVPTGAKAWTPLLYLCFTRLDHAPANENAVEMARLLLDHGADPNAHFMAGDSRYTPLVGAMGEGEEERPPHPARDALVRLLLEHGAEPYDMQVVYNVHFRGDVRWWLEQMYEHAVRRGHADDWADPRWAMLDMGGYGDGARWHLDLAVKRGDHALAEWCLTHGASPRAVPARDPRFTKGTLAEEAARRGDDAMVALLVRHGAVPPAPPPPLPPSRAARVAIERDDADALARMLDAGVSPDDADPATAERLLHAAAAHDAVRCIALLLARGAAVDPKERRFDATPIGFAVWHGHRGAIDLLAAHSRSPFHLAFAGKAERLAAVLAEAPALAHDAADGTTPLMWLPPDEADALRIVHVLLAAGADPSLRDAGGQSAADHARRRGMEDVAAALDAAAAS